MRRFSAALMSVVFILNMFSAALVLAEGGKDCVHAEDCTPKVGMVICDRDKLGYSVIKSENLIDINEFDYTCSTYKGWTSGGSELDDSFYIGEGYNDCSAIFAKEMKTSTAKGSINPYIPLPKHSGEEVFVLSFAVYAETDKIIEWSSAYLCDEDKNNTGYILGVMDGANCKNAVNASSLWAVNSIAFKPKTEDKYVRICMGWDAKVGIDNISIVSAEKKMLTVNERYIENSTAYDEEPLLLGYKNSVETLQYGEKYVSEILPEVIIYENEKYVLVSQNCKHAVISDNDEVDVFYRYIKEKEQFVHPGVLNTEEDLSRIAEKVRLGEEPYLSGYNALLSNGYAQIGGNRATEKVVRGGDGQNFPVLYQDAHRAYLCAIRWKISGDTEYADCARDILNAWSEKLKILTGNADRYLAAGIY